MKKKQKTKTAYLLQAAVRLRAKQIKVSRYTWPAWKRCYPQSPKSEWEKINCPGHVELFVQKIYEVMTMKNEPNSERPSILVVTIDEEYFQWLTDQGKENTDESRQAYIDHIEEEQAYRLLKKHGEHVMLHGAFLQLSHIGPYTQYTQEECNPMSKKTQEMLLQFLQPAFPDGKIYILPYYLTAEMAYHHYHDLQNLAEIYFDEGVTASIRNLYANSKKNPIENALRYIALFTHETVPSAIFSADTVFDPLRPCRVPETVVLSNDMKHFSVPHDEFLMPWKAIPETIATQVQQDLETHLVVFAETIMPRYLLPLLHPQKIQSFQQTIATLAAQLTQKDGPISEAVHSIGGFDTVFSSAPEATAKTKGKVVC